MDSQMSATSTTAQIDTPSSSCNMTASDHFGQPGIDHSPVSSCSDSDQLVIEMHPAEEMDTLGTPEQQQPRCEDAERKRAPRLGKADMGDSGYSDQEPTPE
ncbi:uncharacterized protein LOC106176868 [Lingula anatina]|uniref:Uncharacterized protein LOC106176868 n=1 Tax=Lingula anatina TaxID=7574 RepID=A0A1S3JWS8_LINAN|nr:uncharacterized protein LOC106176868 [Lingula anatina]|eukprot:XP_013414885.1 uncharacterized protein LOC106176868 [Lingula anatina]